ncbi:hypothetical protein IKD56_01805 [bacterium]|nr:hypothetical protein [bacterium]
MKNKCISKKIDVTIDKNHIIEFNNDYNFSNFLEILQKDYENYKKLISNKNNELSELFNKTKNHREKIKNKNIYIDNDYLFNSMLCVIHGS